MLIFWPYFIWIILRSSGKEIRFTSIFLCILCIFFDNYYLYVGVCMCVSGESMRDYVHSSKRLCLSKMMSGTYISIQYNDFVPRRLVNMLLPFSLISVSESLTYFTSKGEISGSFKLDRKWYEVCDAFSIVNEWIYYIDIKY